MKTAEINAVTNMFMAGVLGHLSSNIRLLPGHTGNGNFPVYSMGFVLINENEV